MFGLMRAKTCGMSADEKQFRRLHYCGTCKTIGSLYGQKSRLLLNHDTVFLAEMLTSLNDENVNEWQKSYQSYNCLSLPQTEMPVSLQFAAAANVILSEFKIADHIEDSRQKRFKLAHHIFSKEFIKAEGSLKDWNFPLEKVREILNTQSMREAENSSLETLAEPTAQTTALFFAHGVALIGKSEIKNSVSEIGFAFGKLIYLLDAFEDFEKDAKRNQFNAIRSIFKLTENKLPVEIQRKVTAILRGLESEITAKIDELPINERRKQIFASRLQSNLNKKLNTELPVSVCRTKKRLTFTERFEHAKIRAYELTAKHSWATALPIFVFVLAFAFLSPVHAKEAKSARECFDLSFNLMFIGSIFGTVVSTAGSIFTMDGEPPPTPLREPPPPTPTGPEGNIGKVLPAPKIRQGFGGGPGSGRGNGCSCCGCIGDCDCCCDCGEIGCDGCDCCTGCCEGCGECGSCDC